VRVEVVEPMGNETLLYFTLQNNQMIARGNPNKLYRAASDYSLHINKNKIHFFDKESGITI
jgi:multiple sugar transport system ATP-binding protein